MSVSLHIAFVTPWYGADIPGGAEAELRGLAEHFAAFHEGVEVEVLTTCVKEFTSDWSKNYHKPGSEQVRGVKVTRFPVRKRSTRDFDQVNLKFIKHMAVSKAEEDVFFREMIRSPDLENYITTHAQDIDLFVYIPYMFGTTYWGVKACPERAVLIPCLHDEGYAAMSLVKEMFSQVKGVACLAKPEMELAHKLYPRSQAQMAVLGAGVDTHHEGFPEEFRQKFGLEGPMVLYAGRKDSGKNVDGLLRGYALYKHRYPKDRSKLVLIGGGTIDIPPAIKDQVVDLGFVSIDDKYNAYAAASVLCQPSMNESFSIVIMESWLAGTPVIVNGKCAVTKDFCQQSNAGLYYDSDIEFSEALGWLLSHDDARNKLGAQGSAFVLDHFSWSVVLTRYIEFFRNISAREE